MNNSKLNFDEIRKKDEFIESIKDKLKTEFFGIDKQIDDIINNIKAWFLFPMLQEKPIIINLWGMTGCGKTHLVNRIIELLDIEDSKIYFNMAAIDGSTPNEVDKILSTKVKDFNCSTPIIVIDELQYARTISENGSEINKPSLKPFWNMLDSGKFNVPFDVRTTLSLFKMKEIIDYIVQNQQYEVVEGSLLNGYEEVKALFCRHDDIFSSKMPLFSNYMREVYDLDNDISNNYSQYNMSLSEYNRLIKEDILKIPKEIRPTLFGMYQKEELLKVLSNSKKYNETIKNVGDVYDLISTMDKYQIHELIEYANKELAKGEDVDMSKSLIFVMGNIDEAYTMAFDMNADMSPDQFNKITKNISIVNIKKALQKRFRNEQIARLGNIHIIYPSFDSETYRKIINKILNDYKNNVQEKIGFPIEFDDKLKEAIFKDSIFPTQGARPIFTSIYEIVQTKLPKAFTIATLNNITFDKILYSFSNNKVILTFYENDNIAYKIEIEQELRLDNLRDVKETNFQTLCAVHESGHAVLSMVLDNEIPEKICSITTDGKIGGFVIKPFNKNKIQNKESLLKSVAIKLGGRIAEEIIFGDELISNGASNDLRNVTIMLMEAYKENGFGNILLKNGWSTYSYDDGLDAKINSSTSDDEVLEACEKGKELAITTLKDYYDLFMLLSEYLTKHNAINDIKIKELLRNNGFNELLERLENNKRLEYENIFKLKLSEFKNNR